MTTDNITADFGINAMCALQYDWVERMGWHNKTVLEALALIASEVGEAVNECRGEAPTEAFGEELADIVLRIADLARWQGIDLAHQLRRKMAINEERGTRGRRI
jgi:NTP pyrophosphatase (non-canonical NTP hydrolase)